MAKQVEPWDYPVLQEVTRLDAYGFPIVDIELLTVNYRFVLASIPANCDAMLLAYHKEFNALQWLKPVDRTQE